MKFLLNIIQISSCPSQRWACPCGARGIPVPFHRLSLRYSMHRSQQPQYFLPREGNSFLEKAGGTAFQLFRQITYAQGRRIFNMHMYMVLAHNTFQDTDILRIAYPYQQVATAMLKVAGQNIVTIFGRPD